MNKPKINGVPVTPKQVLELAGLPVIPAIQVRPDRSPNCNVLQLQALFAAGFTMREIQEYEDMPF